MEKVTIGDIDTSKAGEAITNLLAQITQMQQALESSSASTFTSMLDELISKSESFKQLLADLKIDPSTLTFDNISDVFQAELDKSMGVAAQLRGELAQLK